MKKLILIPLSILVLLFLSINGKNESSTNVSWCFIPAGPFTYGNPPETMQNGQEFWIMQYEVTNQMYCQFLNYMHSEGLIFINSRKKQIHGYTNYVYDEETQKLKPQGKAIIFYQLGKPNNQYFNAVINYFSADSNYDIIVPPQFSAEKDLLYNSPVVNVSWWGAKAFAQVFGWRLPTEYEWECAARGNTGFDYPWGNEIEFNNANYVFSKDPFSEGVTPVGFYNGQNHTGILQSGNFYTQDSKSPSFVNMPYPESGGVYDMAGNVWEWCDNWISPNVKNRVKRGGSWYGCQPLKLRSWLRNQGNPEYCFMDIGFRCVSDRTSGGQMNEEWRFSNKPSSIKNPNIMR